MFAKRRTTRCPESLKCLQAALEKRELRGRTQSIPLHEEDTLQSPAVPGTMVWRADISIYCSLLGIEMLSWSCSFNKIHWLQISISKPIQFLKEILCFSIFQITHHVSPPFSLEHSMVKKGWVYFLIVRKKPLFKTPKHPGQRMAFPIPAPGWAPCGATAAVSGQLPASSQPW